MTTAIGDKVELLESWTDVTWQDHGRGGLTQIREMAGAEPGDSTGQAGVMPSSDNADLESARATLVDAFRGFVMANIVAMLDDADEKTLNKILSAVGLDRDEIESSLEEDRDEEDARRMLKMNTAKSGSDSAGDPVGESYRPGKGGKRLAESLANVQPSGPTLQERLASRPRKYRPASIQEIRESDERRAKEPYSTEALENALGIRYSRRREPATPTWLL